MTEDVVLRVTSAYCFFQREQVGMSNSKGSERKRDGRER